jgi:fibronectin type 3 domain-containing protein
MKSLLKSLLTLAGVLLVARNAAATLPTPTPTPIYEPVALSAAMTTASTQDGTNAPGNVVDNKLTTRWSGSGDGAWLQIDLGIDRQLGFAQIAVYRGNERKNSFALETSRDGLSWLPVLSTLSSGATTNLETYDFADQTVRYFRYLGHGSFSNAGVSSPWNSVTEMRLFAVQEPLSRPFAPSEVNAQPAAGRVSLTWVSRNATQFRVSRRLSQCDTYSVVGTTTTTNFTDAAVVDGRHYYYQITALNTFGESAPSTPVAVTPQLQPPPATTLRAITGPVDSGRVDLSWNALATATRYVIRRDLRHPCAIQPTPITILTTLDAPATAFRDTAAVPGRTYMYTITGTNAAGDGARSNVVEIKTLSSAPATPTPTPCPLPTLTPTPAPPWARPLPPIDVTATASHERVLLTWSQPPVVIENRPTGWHVYRGTPSCGPFTLVARNVRAPRYVDRGLTNGTTYAYFVVAVNALGESLDSDVVSAMPQATVPDKPTNVGAFGFFPAPGAALVARVTWTHTFTADTYTVKRGTTSGGPYTTIASGVPAPNPADADAFYDDPSAAPSVAYFYVVVGVNGAGPGPASNEAPFRYDPPVTPTATPTPNPSLRAVPEPDDVRLTWNTVTGATSYQLSRRTSPCVPWALRATVAGPPFTDAAAWPLRYYYDLTAATTDGDTHFRTVGTAPLAGTQTPPVDFGALVGPAPDVRLSWVPRPDAIYWRLYRRMLRSPFCAPAPPAKVLATIEGSSYTDRMVSGGTTYIYELAAVLSSGAEDTRGVVSASIPGTPSVPCPSGLGTTDVGVLTTPTPPPPPPQDVPTAPTGLVATSGHQQVKLSWSSSVDAHFGYRVYRGTDECGPFTWIGSTDVNTFTFADTGLPSGGAPRQYFVTAWNTLGEGPESAAVSARAIAGPPAEGPRLEQVTPRAEGLFVRWTPAYGATAHVVKRRALPSGTFVTIATSLTDSYVDVTAVLGVQYEYVAAGTNAFGEGPISPFPLSGTPGPGYVEVTPPPGLVTASTNDGNLPSRVVDNDLATRWSGNGDGAWLNLDLGGLRQVGYVKVAVYRGNQRRNRFELWLSSDGINWNKYPQMSNGATLEEEVFDVPDQMARHVRYVGHGATMNDGASTSWNSVTEVSVFATTVVPNPTPTPPPAATERSRASTSP